MNPQIELDVRRPVWSALSELFLDTHLGAEDLDRIARRVAASPYSERELDAILLWEVYPACHTNMYWIAGEWAGFDEQWLESRVLKGFWFPRRLWAGTVGRLSVFSSFKWRAIKDRVRIIREGGAPLPKIESKRSMRRKVVLVAFPAVVLWAGLQAFVVEPRQLVIREIAMPFRCWTGEPLRIGVISDLHIGSPGFGLEKLDVLVDHVNGARPDLVLLLGDYVIQGVAGGRFVPPEAIVDRLRAMRAPLGVHAVLGNHDWWLNAPRVTQAFQDAGIPVLEDASVPIRRGQDSFWLVGISDFWEGTPNVTQALSQVNDDRPVIAMTHNPDIFPSVPSRVCLTIAGHTHGGQVNLPLLGRPIVPSRYGSRYAAGEIEEDGKRLFVTTGLGTSIFPVRFRVPPEVVILTVSAPR